MQEHTTGASLGRHFVQFYKRDAPLLDEVADFIESGLRSGDAGIVIATAAHREALALRLRLAFGDNLSEACPGEYIALDAAETLDGFMVEGWPDAQRFRNTVGALVESASARGARSVCAFGEMVALLCEQNRHEAAVQLEKLWDELLRHQPVSLFCAYPLHLFSQAEHARMFERVCTHHTHVLPPELRLEDAGDKRHDLALAQLQHKAAMLEAEVGRRREAEQALRRREQELAELLGRLQSANRTKDEFLAMLGHELRNPLAPIVTALQLMKMRGDGQTTAEFGLSMATSSVGFSIAFKRRFGSFLLRSDTRTASCSLTSPRLVGSMQ